MTARELALNVLNNITENSAYADLALNKALQNEFLIPQDKALATAIVYGTIQNLIFLDYQIKSLSGDKFENITHDVKNILRISLFQLWFLDKIPESAAVNEGVNLTKKKAVKASGFVNAILRNSIRKGKFLPAKSNLADYLSVRYSYPKWMTDLFLDELGAQETERFFESSEKVPPIYIRANSLKTDKQTLARLIDAKDTEYKNALILENVPGGVASIKEYKDGLFTVQDIASQIAVEELLPRPDDRVLDTCAAPGGKTTYIAELMQNKGEIIAWDVYSHKIKIINNAAARLGIDIIKAEAHDAREEKKEYFEYFDKILVDAPCSGLGIIRKKPDIKFARKKEDISALQKEQLNILDNSSKMLKNGGILLYSTCTLTKTENSDCIMKFLKDHPEFSFANKPRTLYPHVDGTDGFYICLLKKDKK